MKPVIGITVNYLDDLPSAVDAGIAAPGQDWYLLAADYINSVMRAGGLPVMLPYTDDEAMLAEYVELCDGILVTGGNDVTPALYNERVTKCGRLFPHRDKFDLALTRYALENTEIPIFGICRGCQIFNVALGGTLYQDLPSDGYLPHTILSFSRNYPSHTVKVSENSRLASILGAGDVPVNSFHHQAIKNLAPGAVCSAVSEDGVQESIELPGDRFFLAVQWHPEMMYDSIEQQKLFTAFVEAAAK